MSKLQTVITVLLQNELRRELCGVSRAAARLTLGHCFIIKPFNQTSPVISDTWRRDSKLLSGRFTPVQGSSSEPVPLAPGAAEAGPRYFTSLLNHRITSVGKQKRKKTFFPIIIPIYPNSLSQFFSHDMAYILELSGGFSEAQCCSCWR